MVDRVRLSPPAELALPIGEAMFTQRAIRKFKPDPISDAQLELILDAASRAPNGGNFQPARFLVIRDPERIRAFGALYREAWWAKRRDGPGWTRSEEIPPSEKGFLAAAQLADEIAAVASAELGRQFIDGKVEVAVARIRALVRRSP